MLSYARMRAVHGQTEQTVPSRFLRDIAPRYLRMMTGSSLGDAPRTSARRPVQSSVVAPQPRPEVASTVVRRAAAASAPAPSAPKAAASGFPQHAVAELSEGQRIEHPTFGLGVIENIDADRPDPRISVRFSADSSLRTLLLKFARFKLLS